MMPGESRRQSADPNWVPSQSPPPKGEATLVPGESRQRKSAEPAWGTSKAPPPKGEATLVPGESRQRKSAEPAWGTSKAPPPKGEATLVPGESRPPHGRTELDFNPGAAAPGRGDDDTG